MLKKCIAICFILFSFNVLANDEQSGFWHYVKKTLSDTWNSNQYELYIPANTWHNRATYDKDRIDKYNERPWGIGAGVYRFDEDGDWHALYIMEFQDSHNVIEPIGGYAYQTYWRPGNSEKLRIGIGYTIGITARRDYNWIPFPAPLPLVSLEYNRLSIQSAYVPGVKRNTGNILFTWLRWQL